MATIFELTDYLSRKNKLLICTTIGLGLGLFLLASFLGFLGLDLPIALPGIVSFVLGVVWFLKVHKKMGFGAIASVLTIVLMPIATIPLCFIYNESLGIFLQATIDGLALLFLGSGFLAIGLIGVYIEKRPKKLGFFFIILSLIFLIGVPLVNGYQVLASRFGSTWIATPYEGYTIPLILVSAAFFLFGCVSVLYMKFLGTRKNLVGTTAIENGKTEGDFTHEKREEVIGGRRFFVSSCGFGFICLILGSLCLIGAAVMYAPAGPFMWSIPQSSSRELTLPLIIFSVALFTLGFNFILYKKAERFGFLVGVLGSFFLIASSFAYGYKIKITEWSFGYVLLSRSVNPLNEHALLLFLASVPFLVIGYTIMLGKRHKIASHPLFNLKRVKI